MRIEPATQDLAIEAGDLGDASPVHDAVRLRLHVHRGSCFWDSSFGSTLHQLARAKVTTRTAVRVEDAIRVALAPMVKAGELAIEGFAHEQPEVSRWHTVITLRDRQRRPVTFHLFLKVAE